MTQPSAFATAIIEKWANKAGRPSPILTAYGTPSDGHRANARIKHGDALFTGTDYPHTWAGFVGQREAVNRITTAIKSAKARNQRLDHILLASGQHGIGKTSIAQIIAHDMNVGMLSVSGAMNVDEARELIMSMSDNDILFWDEFHLAVTGNRTRADWLLPLLQDGLLMTKRGAERMPNITVIAATTDVGVLPLTIISRFMVQPKLDAYTQSEGTLIAMRLAERMQVSIDNVEARRISTAANRNPRAMRVILTGLRDQSASDSPRDLELAFTWAGVTPDGLTREAIDMLLILLASPGMTASIDTIKASLSEPGPMRHHEQLLLQRGLIAITGRGRTLTDIGLERATQMLREME